MLPRWSLFVCLSVDWNRKTVPWKSTWPSWNRLTCRRPRRLAWQRTDHEATCQQHSQHQLLPSTPASATPTSRGHRHHLHLQSTWLLQCCSVWATSISHRQWMQNAAARVTLGPSLPIMSVRRWRNCTGCQSLISLLSVRQYGTVCLGLSDQLRLLLVLSASWKPICSTFRFNLILSFINIVMPSCSCYVVDWALNYPHIALYCIGCYWKFKSA